QYEQAKEIIEDNCNEIDSELLLEDLFNRSLIGTIDRGNNFVKFKHKISKKEVVEYSIDKNAYIIVHSGLKVYLQNR
ncbi:TPA: hypothetical protein MB311_005113, partial [Klebsiella pneumoniae]